MRNAGWLLSGHAISGTLSLAALLIAARYLGPAQFGIIALITTYVALVDRLLNFQTWQALIRFGAKANADANAAAFRRLVKVCTLLDLGSALLGAALAVTFATTVASLIGLSGEAGHLMKLYSLVIAANLSGVPTAVLRLFDRFRLLAAYRVVQSAMTIAGVTLAWVANGGIGGVLLAMAGAQIAGYLFLLTCGWWVLADKGISGVWKEPVEGLRRDSPGLLGFVIWTNIESSVKILRELDVFVVKALLSMEAVGFYHVARKLASTMETAVAPFYYAIYPELARFSAKRRLMHFIRLMWQSAVTVGCLAGIGFVVFLILGNGILVFVLGDAYGVAYGVSALCLLGSTIWSAAQPLSAAMFSLGQVRLVFLIHLATATFYIISLVPLLTSLGLTGAGIAYALLHAIWAALAVFAVKAGLDKESVTSPWSTEEPRQKEKSIV